MELLDERWTILVIRELMLGSRNFSALQRGLPRMSPTLLSARLRTLARAGVVERHQDGNRVSYTLTPAGQELRPIVEALGQWGTVVQVVFRDVPGAARSWWLVIGPDEVDVCDADPGQDRDERPGQGEVAQVA